MKKTILFLFVCAVAITSCKKNVSGTSGDNGSVIVPASSVPSAVISAFNSTFAGATEVEWRHNSDDSFTSQFNDDGQRHEAKFDDHGNEKEHNIICLEAPVPQVVLDAFRNAFPQETVFEWKLTNENTWKAHFMKNSVQWEVTFDSNGNNIKTEHD